MDSMKKLLAIEASMNARTLECESEVEAVLAAMVLGHHCVLIGPPGTGKSRIVDDACYYMGNLTLFRSLLHRFIEPEELTGPLSIPDLKQGVYKHLTAGHLPAAEVAYLDEIFNASSALLNTLLNLLNERTFAGQKTPLRAVVGSTNQLPEGLNSIQPDVQTSKALYDRFLVRLMVRPIQSDRAWAEMMLGRADAPRDSSLVLTREQVSTLSYNIEQVQLGTSTMRAMLRLRSELVRNGVTVSDRRWRQCLPLMKFRAAKEGRVETLPKDMLILQHALWTTPDQISRVAEAVLGTAVPALLVARKTEAELVGEVTALRSPELPSDQYLDKAITLNTKMLTEIKRLEDVAKEAGAVPEVVRVLKWMRSVQQEIAVSIAKKTGATDSASSSIGALLADLGADVGNSQGIGFR